jgi:hypothetical protein
MTLAHRSINAIAHKHLIQIAIKNHQILTYSLKLRSQYVQPRFPHKNFGRSLVNVDHARELRDHHQKRESIVHRQLRRNFLKAEVRERLTYLLDRSRRRRVPPLLICDRYGFNGVSHGKHRARSSVNALRYRHDCYGLSFLLTLVPPALFFCCLLSFDIPLRSDLSLHSKPRNNRCDQRHYSSAEIACKADPISRISLFYSTQERSDPERQKKDGRRQSNEERNRRYTNGCECSTHMLKLPLTPTNVEWVVVAIKLIPPHTGGVPWV